MSRRKGVLFGKWAAAILVVPMLLFGYSSNPPPGLTGAPGEGTCASCHSSAIAGSGITLTLPGGMTYTPGGAAISLTTSVTGGNAGFELSSRISSSNAQAGTLASGTNSAVNTSNAIQYLDQTVKAASWQFQWTPPATNVGSVIFYLCGVDSGGQTYTNKYTLTPAVAANPNLSVSPTSLTFTSSGGAAPPSQTFNTTSSGSALTFTTSASTTSGGNWLSASAGGTTPSTVTVSVNPAGLAAGTYTGSVSVASTGAANSPQSVGVTLNVTAPTSVSSLVCAPSTLGSAGKSTCTVTLSQAAPTGGAVVTLSSNNAALTVPASTTVSAGATTTTFTATAGTIASNQTANVTASYNSSSQQATLSLTASTALSSLSCNPTTLGSAGTSACNVTLTQAAPSGGALIQLSSNNALLTAPATITIASGLTSASFTATAGTITSAQSATLTASYNSVSQTANISLTVPVVLSSMSCTPSTLGSSSSSTCTVTLSTGAPSGGLTVSLSSSNAMLTVPASVTVAAGSASNTFTTTSGTLSTNQSATVTATYNGVTKTASFTLTAPTVVSTLACSPTTLSSAATSKCTVTMSQPAPAGGMAVTLSVDNPLVTVPASVSVASGATTNTFTATAGSITSNQTANVTAAYNGSSASTPLTLLPPVLMSTVSCNPTTLASSATSSCTVTLSSAAPAGGAAVSLSSSNALLTVPASVTVAAGATSNTFTATVGVITSSQSATVTATYNNSSMQANFTLSAPPTINSLSCSSTSLGSSQTSTCSITLSAPAPMAGATVTLASNNPLLMVPATVTVAGGASFANFITTAGTITSNQTAMLTVTYNSNSQQVAISLTGQSGVSSLVCAPNNLMTAGTATCSLILAVPAPQNGATVTLASDNPLVTLPATVTVSGGATTATFVVTAGTIPSTQGANITAVYGSSSISAALSLSAQSALSSFSCQSATVNSGGALSCSVTLVAPAPVGGSTITLSSSNPTLQVPANVVVPASALTASFSVTAVSVSASQTATITATLSGAPQTTTVTIVPGPNLVSQGSNNQLLSGNYFVRQVSLGTDTSGNLTNPQSAIGTIAFDGAGHYGFTGQLNLNGTAGAQTASGAYSIDSAGMVILDSLVQAGQKVNARFGAEAVIGSTTEAPGNRFDMLVAIPAPIATTGNTALSGSYWTASLEFPNGSAGNARNSLFLLNSTGAGTLPTFSATGHAANYNSGHVVTQQITGASYNLAPDGSGTLSLGTTSNVVGGTKTVYVSQDGNILLGGTPSGYDIVIGIKGPNQTASNAYWSGPFWSTGLRQDPATVKAFAGSVVASGSGSLYWTRRTKTLGAGVIDLSEVDSYSINPDGSGAAQMAAVALGAGGNAFLGSSLNSADPNGYQIYFGIRMPASASPVTNSPNLNPQGVQNAASFAPTGNPISPGELIYLYVSGLVSTPQSATPPYPLSLGGVTVLINGNPAPLYLVTPTILVALVPYATTGPTATIVVQTNGQTSNTVNVPVAATNPGVFSLQQNGSGLGAIRHGDYSVVTTANPAHSGEVVLIYLTGLGTVNPPLADGYGGNANPLSVTLATPGVTVGGSLATVLFSGMSSYPGLYQINAQLPAIPAGVSTLPLTITTPNAQNSEVSIAVAP